MEPKKASRVLKAVHLVSEGSYIVEVPYGVKLEIDGIRFDQRSLVFDDPSSIKMVIPHPPQVIGWRADDGSELSTDVHREEKAARLVGAEYVDYEWQFSNLDAEYEWKKFQAKWTPVKGEASEELHPVELEVVEVRTESGDEDIKSLWNAPGMHVDRKLYEINLDSVQTREFFAFCSANGLSAENEGRSYLRFAKVEGIYAFDDSFDERRRNFMGTLEQCKEAKAGAIRKVRGILWPHAAKKSNTQLPNVGDVVMALRSIESKLMSVRAKVDSGSALMAARKSIAELMKSLQKGGQQ